MPEGASAAKAGVEKARVAVFISGSGTNMAALLYASRAADCPFEIVLVLSNNPEAGGLALARAEGVATFALPHKGVPRADHDAAMEAEVIRSGARYIALAGYMRILSPEFVARWQGRMVNIHPSLLPKYTGLHTHERALAAGDSHGGCTSSPPTSTKAPFLARRPWQFCPATRPTRWPPACSSPSISSMPAA